MADETMTPEQEAERVRLEQAAADEKARLDKESAAERERVAKENEQKKAAKAAAKEAKAAPVAGPNSAERMRAFEDEVFGKRAVRINGQIERGVGSPYAAMTDERKAQYAALEALVAAEQKLNDATAAVGAAEAERVAAQERLAQCDKTANEADVEAKKEQAEIEQEARKEKV